MSLELSVTSEVDLPRTCAHCGHSWSYHFTLRQSWDTDWALGWTREEVDRSKEKIYAELQKKIETQHHQLMLEPRQSIVCPSCCHLADEAVRAFFPHGYRAGLAQHWMSKGKRKWGVMIPFAIGGVFFLWIGSDEFANSLGLSLAGACMLLLALGCVIYELFVMSWFNKRILTWVHHMTEDGALQTIVTIAMKSEWPVDPRWPLLWYYLRRNRRKHRDSAGS